MAPPAPTDTRNLEPARKPRSRLTLVLLALVGVALFIGFIALGTWQVQRRAWKLDLIARVEQRVHATPVPLRNIGSWTAVTRDAHEYRPVQAHGVLLTDKTLLAKAVTELGAGYWVMTPLDLQDGTCVWINRGFVLESAGKVWALPRQPDGSVVTVTGLLRMNEPRGGFLRRNDAQAGRWYSRDVLAMTAAQGLSHAAPFFIDAGLPGDQPTSSDGPRPGMTVIKFYNQHAAYAVTWYVLALMVIGAAWIVVRYERRRSQGVSSDDTP